jgi:farnesyl diphosphate synthase
MNQDLKTYLITCQVRVESALTLRLPSNHILPLRLHEAMRYSVLNGGKRMRPLLTYATGLCC